MSIAETLSIKYINISFYNSNGTPWLKANIKLYRCSEQQSSTSTSTSNPDNLFNWNSNYDGPATLEDVGTSNVYKAAGWYFEDNKTYYHFRTTTATLDQSNRKNFTITSGFSDDAHTMGYDPHWGAPMKYSTESNYKPKYNPITTDENKKGFGEYISSAIGSTDAIIAITEFHMLSNVIVKLKTTDTGDGSHVDLTNAKVKMLNLSTSATVEMGTGFITPDAVQNSLELFYQSNSEKLYYFSPIVPQLLKRADNATVGIQIETTDNNVYKLDDISSYKPNSVENSQVHNTSSAVDRWYPGTQYTYTFTLKKTGIEQVTCTIVNWDKVAVDVDDPITIQ